ncbi:MAG TPA: glycerol kinase [Micromonosporaceae bacterium]|nr:glycerol kinase [Micromonosporaceae bacterium]
MLFGSDAQVLAVAQREHRQSFPQPGWVEHDPLEIWANTKLVVAEALQRAGLTSRDLSAVGITNQRETTVVWDRHTGHPVCPAIVWQDTRTAALLGQFSGVDFRQRCGLPLATYFSAPKLRWIFDRYPVAAERAAQGDLLAGTMDSWLIWNLSGRKHHVTDVTNASRTMLMNLHTLDWDPVLLDTFGVPKETLPAIRPSATVYGEATGVLAGVPIAAMLGDQQAALFGQGCTEQGQVKATFGTGAFLLMNTGTQPQSSSHGLLTTVGYQIGDTPAVYALEGSIAVAGSLVQWLRDKLGIISSAADIEPLASQVSDTGGCYLVPAFSGLYAPHWRGDARGVIAGLTGYVTKAHLARAALEATAWQTRDVVAAMQADTGLTLHDLRVDGGMSANGLFLRLLADSLGVIVRRPRNIETTALGAALAAGLTTGFFLPGTQQDVDLEEKPELDGVERDHRYRSWQKAVQRSFGWTASETKG